MALKIGMQFGQQNIELEELRRLWRFADEHGFDFVSIWDHFYESPPTDGSTPAFEAIACMAAIAADTSNVRIGCHVMCVNYRNPGLLAKSIVTLDHLSGGRIELGLGAGWHVPEHEAYGYQFSSAKVRSDRLEEGIQALRLLLTEDVADFEGEHFQLRGAKVRPQPLQKRLPLVIGGRGERRTLRTAARYGDGWNVPYIDSEEFEPLLGVLDEWCEREDRDPAELERSINLHMLMGANAADADRILSERGAVGGAVSGTPQQAIEALKRYEDAGAARLSIAIRPPIEWDALQAFVEEVIPAVR